MSDLKANQSRQHWDVTFDQVRWRQILDIALLTTPAERFAQLEQMIRTLRPVLERSTGDQPS